jgi:sulfonate transport system substrate-binding protein
MPTRIDGWNLRVGAVLRQFRISTTPIGITGYHREAIKGTCVDDDSRMQGNPMLRRIGALAALLGLIAGLAGCGRDAKEAAPLVLHVGDQLNALQAALAAAGEDKPAGYRIEWANFVGGPTIIAAETGGSIDVGWMQETPVVFAQAAGSPVKVVAVARSAIPGRSGLALVTSPDSPVKAVGDLRGRAIGYMPGTVTQYVVVRLLEQAGLKLSDVRAVHVSGNATSLLATGDVDAIVTADPYLTQMLDAGKVRILATGGEPITADFRYLVAPDTALADPVRAAAIGDFAGRVARAYRWQREHAAQAAPTYARLYKSTPEMAAKILQRAPVRFGLIDDTVIARHQQEADTFHSLGLLRRAVDASQIFDRRYNSLITAQEPIP